MKLLLCHGVFIGDVILSTSILPALKKADPTLQIGFMTGSWAKEVVSDHIHVDWVHLYDFPFFNREKISYAKKKKRAKEMRRAVLPEIKAIGYDAALQFSPFYAGDLLYQAAIPKRISHLLVGSPHLFNDLYFWELLPEHIVENHKRMLEALGIEKAHFENISPSLEYKNPLPKGALDERLPKEYLLFHMGTGDPGREWPLHFWKELVARLTPLHLPFVFVGKGAREALRIREVRESLPDAIDLSNQLSFRELMEVVRRARCVIGVESMCGHVAAFFKRPGVFIYSGYAPTGMWRPYSPTCHIVTPKGCDPEHGSSDPFLMKTITPDEVEKRVLEIFSLVPEIS